MRDAATTMADATETDEQKYHLGGNVFGTVSKYTPPGHDAHLVLIQVRRFYKNTRDELKPGCIGVAMNPSVWEQMSGFLQEVIGELPETESAKISLMKFCVALFAKRIMGRDVLQHMKRRLAKRIIGRVCLSDVSAVYQRVSRDLMIVCRDTEQVFQSVKEMHGGEIVDLILCNITNMNRVAEKVDEAITDIHGPRADDDDTAEESILIE